MPDPHALVNHPQREHLSVLLAQMEDALDKLALAADPARGVHRHLTIVDDDLPASFAEQIEPIVARLREHIARLSADFRLPRRRMSRARLAAATITAELIRIEDSYARNLGGYGAVAPELASVLDPALHELHDDWSMIHRALGADR